MAKVTKEELMEQLKTYLKEDTSDEALSLIENVNDSFGETIDTSDKDKEIKSLQDKLEEQDKMWREKYRDAFFSGTPKGDDNDPATEHPHDEDEEDNSPHTFEDLFKPKSQEGDN